MTTETGIIFLIITSYLLIYFFLIFRETEHTKNVFKEPTRNPLSCQFIWFKTESYSIF